MKELKTFFAWCLLILIVFCVVNLANRSDRDHARLVALEKLRPTAAADGPRQKLWQTYLRKRWSRSYEASKKAYWNWPKEYWEAAGDQAVEHATEYYDGGAKSGWESYAK